MTLEITREKILQVASRSVDAEGLLNELFPAAFVDEEQVKVQRSYECRPEGNGNSIVNGYLHGSNGSKYAGRAFWLSNDYDWKIEYDKAGNHSVLVPRKK